MGIEQLARYEYKYIVHPRDLDQIRAFVSMYCDLDKNAKTQSDGIYTVDSLYYDSDDLRIWNDAMAKLPKRFKLRVRTYPDYPDSVVKFEVKHRLFDLITKTSTVVPREDWVGWLDGRRDVSMLSADSQHAIGEFLSLRNMIGARPAMMVRYRRQAFHSRVDDYVRITFDSGMQCQPQNRYVLDTNPMRWIPIDGPGFTGIPGGVLIELKFKQRPPVWMADLVRRFDMQRQGFSKYGNAIFLTRYERCDDWDCVPAMRGAA